MTITAGRRRENEAILEKKVLYYSGIKSVTNQKQTVIHWNVQCNS